MFSKLLQLPVIEHIQYFFKEVCRIVSSSCRNNTDYSCRNRITSGLSFDRYGMLGEICRERPYGAVHCSRDTVLISGTRDPSNTDLGRPILSWMGYFIEKLGSCIIGENRQGTNNFVSNPGYKKCTTSTFNLTEFFNGLAIASCFFIGLCILRFCIYRFTRHKRIEATMLMSKMDANIQENIYSVLSRKNTNKIEEQSQNTTNDEIEVSIEVNSLLEHKSRAYSI